MLKDIIETFEELKKYVFIVNRGDKKNIIITFNDSNFYHLIGLHKMGIDRFFPDYIKTKSRKYEYIKKNIDKFDGIIKNHIKEEIIYCAPQSWMADKRSNVLTKNKKPLYMSVIVPVSVNIFKDDFIYA